MKTWIVATISVVLLSAGWGVIMWAVGREGPDAKFAREEISRASQFHAYNGAIKADQGRLRDFIAEWTKVCSQKGLALQMDPTGDPGCAKPAPTPAPSAPPAAPAPSAPSAVK